MNTRADGQLSTSQIVTGDIHVWPGSSQIHTVPHGFMWPSYPANTMWNLWFLGDASKRMCPFKNIKPAFDLPKTLCKSNRCRTKRIMKRLVDIAISGKLIDHERDITPGNMQSVYEYAYPILLRSLYNESPTRPEDININTLANRIPKTSNRRKRNIQEHNDSEDSF